jgi:hypothetical protein
LAKWANELPRSATLTKKTAAFACLRLAQSEIPSGIDVCCTCDEKRRLLLARCFDRRERHGLGGPKLATRQLHNDKCADGPFKKFFKKMKKSLVSLYILH